MANKTLALEEFISSYLEENKRQKSADSYAEYLHKNGLGTAREYAEEMDKLYAKRKTGNAEYGINKRNIDAFGLQNSGYADFVNNLSDNLYKRGVNSAEQKMRKKELDSMSGYLGYLEKHTEKRNQLKNDVMSYLVKNQIVDLEDAVRFAIDSGLDENEALAVADGAYRTNKQKVFNEILKQVASLGLDTEGAVMLARKMGVSDKDAESFGEEISELLEYYGSISDEYLAFLEEQASKTTNTFN